MSKRSSQNCPARTYHFHAWKGRDSQKWPKSNLLANISLSKLIFMTKINVLRTNMVSKIFSRPSLTTAKKEISIYLLMDFTTEHFVKELLSERPLYSMGKNAIRARSETKTLLI